MGSCIHDPVGKQQQQQGQEENGSGGPKPNPAQGFNENKTSAEGHQKARTANDEKIQVPKAGQGRHQQHEKGIVERKGGDIQKLRHRVVLEPVAFGQFDAGIQKPDFIDPGGSQIGHGRENACRRQYGQREHPPKDWKRAMRETVAGCHCRRKPCPFGQKRAKDDFTSRPLYARWI